MLALKIDGTWTYEEKIVKGYTITETIDDTLDFAVVKYFSNTANCYEPNTPAWLGDFVPVAYQSSTEAYFNSATNKETIDYLYQGVEEPLPDVTGKPVDQAMRWREWEDEIGSGTLRETTYWRVVFSGQAIEDLPAVAGNYKFWLVMNDTSNTKRRLASTEYEHTLTLVEPTKYLERIICSVDTSTWLGFVDLKSQADKLLINAEPLVDTVTPRFSFHTDTQTALTGVDTSEFYFGVATFREQLDEVFAKINAKAYVPKITSFDNIVIYHYDKNKFLDNIELLGGFNTEQSHDLENFAERIKSFGHNALSSRTNYIIHGWDVIRPGTLESLSTSNAVIQLQTSIEELKKMDMDISVNVDLYNISSDAEHTFNARYVFDVTELFFEEQIYNLLTVAQQNTSLYYTRGSDAITSIQKTYKQLFGTGMSFKAALDEYFSNYDFSDNPAQIEKPEGYESENWVFLRVRNYYTLAKTVIENILFRITYLPYVDFHFDITNPDNLKTNTSAMIDNQTSNIIDVFAYGNNLQQKAERLGNQEINKDLVIDSISQLKQLGDYTDDNEIITTIAYSRYDNFVKVRYSLTKNYAALYERIAMDRRKTLYNIPLEGDETDILVKNYINISTALYSGATVWGLNEFGMYSIIACLTNDRTLGYRVKGFLTEVKQYNSGDTDFNLYYYYLYSNNYCGGNGLYFKMRFLDNYNAGLSTSTFEIGGRKVVCHPYVNDQGVFDDMEFGLVYDIPNVTSLAKINNLPRVLKTDVTKPEDMLSNDIVLTRYKDPYITIGITYQAELLAADNIIIGKKFIENNLLAFNDEFVGTMKVYISDSPYKNNEVFKVKGTLTTLTITPNVVDGIGQITISAAPSVYWAIGDDEGNLYLAVNQTNINVVYFTPTKIPLGG